MRSIQRESVRDEPVGVEPASAQFSALSPALALALADFGCRLILIIAITIPKTLTAIQRIAQTIAGTCVSFAKSWASVVTFEPLRITKSRIDFMLFKHC